MRTEHRLRRLPIIGTKECQGFLPEGEGGNTLHPTPLEKHLLATYNIDTLFGPFHATASEVVDG